MMPLDLQSRPQLAPGVRLQTDAVTGDPVLLYPEGVLVLNEAAHEVARRCDGRAKVGEMVSELAAEYDADESTLQADALECLGDLLARNLIVLPA